MHTSLRPIQEVNLINDELPFCKNLIDCKPHRLKSSQDKIMENEAEKFIYP